MGVIWWIYSKLVLGKENMSNELVVHTPEMVKKAVAKIDLDTARIMDEEGIFDTVLGLMPEDDEKDGWLTMLGYATLGMREGGEELSKQVVEDIIDCFQDQLEADEKRWGDTWKKRPVEGQGARTQARLVDYMDQHYEGGQEIPWEKIAGGAIICLTRLEHPEYLEG